MKSVKYFSSKQGLCNTIVGLYKTERGLMELATGNASPLKIDGCDSKGKFTGIRVSFRQEKTLPKIG